KAPRSFPYSGKVRGAHEIWPDRTPLASYSLEFSRSVGGGNGGIDKLLCTWIRLHLAQAKTRIVCLLCLVPDPQRPARNILQKQRGNRRQCRDSDDVYGNRISRARCLQQPLADGRGESTTDNRADAIGN